MTAARLARNSLVAVTLFALAASPTVPAAQVPGENVNMVTGTQWPGGDPFLQRQNEPSIAVSSANPQHLLAGANDYRSVDVPFPASIDKMPGDAWLGLFKSYNGGLTWQSVLLPGFPQDASPEGSTGGMKACGGASCTSAADPVIRSGPDGMLYYSGIKFARGTTHGKVFVARFIDLNNKENGDPTAAQQDNLGLPTIATPTDPIRYVDSIDIASEIDPDGLGSGYFLDKPWIAIDKPRNGTTCPVSVVGPDGAVVTRNVAAGAMYMAYVRFAPKEVSSDILFTRSTNCGKDWSPAIKLNDATSLLNQAPGIAIDPVTGFVYVTWRRIAIAKTATTASQTDAIMVARSFQGTAFTKPRAIASFKPFEQDSTGSMFRTKAFPSIAISVDPTSTKSWAHVVWPQRQGPYNEGHVVIATAPVAPAPTNGQESSDACSGWGTPVAVDDVGITDDTMKRVFNRGHQFMPTITFSQGKLMVFYYDSRLDHTAGEFLPNLVNGVFQPDALGRFYIEERTPIAMFNPATGKNDAPESPSNVFATPYIDDATMKKVRHTIEVRVGSAPAGGNPVFSSVQVSKYRFGERGNEPARLSVQPFKGSDPLSLESDTRKWLPVTDGTKYVRLQQFDVNTPNLPLFKNGSVPFMGDYVDIQGPVFVLQDNGTWTFNTKPTPAPVFHAVWTTNQDVRAPVAGTTWKDFTPMKLPTGQTVFDGGVASAGSVCTPGAPANAGIRNQNIYTSRITEGLHVSSPQNVKPLYADQTTSFVVSALNDSSTTRSFRFAFTGVPLCAVDGSAMLSPACASFRPDAVLDHVDVEVLPHSSATRSIFVRSTNPDLPIVVSVTELVVQAPCTLSRCSCPPATIGLSGRIILNPPGSNPSMLAMAAPDGSGGIGPGSPESVLVANVSTANVSTANVSTANVSTANISTANVSTANVSTANVSTANVSTANVTTANISTANVSTANVSTANVSTANVSTANVSTANVSTANVSTASISDLNYQVTNNGNTTTSYTVQFVCTDPAGCTSAAQTPIKLMVNKFYTVPSSIGCELYAEPRPVLVANGGLVQDRFIDPTRTVDPNVTDGSAGNATLALAPGESAQITLRGPLTLVEMAKLGSRITPAIVPHSLPVVPTQTYASSTLAGFPTVTTLTVTPGVFQVNVDYLDSSRCASNGDGCYNPTGTVTLIQDGNRVVGTSTIDWGGSALFEYTLPAGSTVTAYYGGDAYYNASTSPAADRRVTTQTTLSIPFAPPSQVGQSVPVTVRFQTRAIYGTPTGTVELLDGTTSLGTLNVACTTSPDVAALECGATFNVTTLALGSHSLIGRYGGNTAFAPSTSPARAWDVVASLDLFLSGDIGPANSAIQIRLGSGGAPASGASVQAFLGGSASGTPFFEDPASPGTYRYSGAGIPQGTDVSLAVTWQSGLVTKQVTGSITIPYQPSFSIAGATYDPGSGNWTVTGGTQTITANWTTQGDQAANTSYELQGPDGTVRVAYPTSSVNYVVYGPWPGNPGVGWFFSQRTSTWMWMTGDVIEGSSVTSGHSGNAFIVWVYP